MSMKGKTLVGLDVHAAQTHAAVLETLSGELRVRRLNGPPGEVVRFLEELGRGVHAVYEAGPTGFGLARAARERGIVLDVVAPGSIPKGPTDHVKTDRRDAVRLARLLAAGELRFAFVPSVADEQFRDLVRSMLARRQHGADPRVIAVAWRAQQRPHQRWHHLREQRRKPAGVVAVACARELATFLWEAATLD